MSNAQLFSQSRIDADLASEQVVEEGFFELFQCSDYGVIAA